MGGACQCLSVPVEDGVLGVVGDVLGDEALHGGDGGHVVEGAGEGDQGVDLRAHLRPVVFPHARHADLLVERRPRLLLVAEHLLVELLAVAKARVLDLNALRSAQLDHAPRQVGDTHRLPHVEHEDLTALASCAGLKDKLARLRDQHEEPYDVRVRHGHGAAGLDLPLEQRDHRAVGAQDVAEARRDELGRSPHRAVALGLVQALHVDLADALAAPHHVRRVHSLVGGHHHEAANAVADGQVRQDLRAKDVVVDALARVVLHHRNVLVGRRVEHVLRTERPEYVLHPPGVRDRGHDRGARHVRVSLPHHQADVVLRGLRRVDQHQLRRAERRHLADDLAPDAPGRAGDQHAAAAEGLGHGPEVDADLVPRKEVVYANLPERRGALDHVLLRVHDVVRRVDHGAASEDDVLEGRVVAQALDPARGHKHGVDAAASDHLGERPVRLVHRLPHQARALGEKRRVVRDEATQAEAHRLLAADRLREADAPGLHTVDQHAPRALRAEVGVVHAPDRHPHGPHQARGHQLRRHDLAHLNVGEPALGQAVRHVVREDHRQRRAAHGIGHAQKVVERRVADDPAVRAEHREEHQVAPHEHGQKPHQGPEVSLERRTPVEAPVGEHARQHQDQAVQKKDTPVRKRPL